MFVCGGSLTSGQIVKEIGLDNRVNEASISWVRLKLGFLLTKW